VCLSVGALSPAEDRSEWDIKWNRMKSHLIHEIHHCTNTPKHERNHHQLVFMLSCQMPLHQQNQTQWQSCTSNIKLPIILLQHEIDKLDREGSEEEDIEFDKALVHLVLGIKLLYPPVGTQEFEDLPTELVVDPPAKSDEGNFGEADDNGEDGGEDCDGDVGGGGDGVYFLDFSDLDEGGDEEEGVEEAEHGLVNDNGNER
jgi:hypothetical protein